MTWFKKDDGFPIHSKARAAGKDGRALWDTASALCAREDLDGVIPGHMLAMWAAIAEVPVKKATNLLVASGLWHRHDALCDRCLDNRDEHAVLLEAEGRELTPLNPGDHYFHDWCKYQLDKDGKDDPIKRKRDRRRKQRLASPEQKASAKAYWDGYRNCLNDLTGLGQPEVEAFLDGQGEDHG